MAPELTNLQARLDASESLFFERQLESIDARQYNVKFPLLKGRNLIPKVSNVGTWDTTYTYHQYEGLGKAKIIAPGATDLPRVDALGREFKSSIKDLGAEYGYTIGEIRAAMAKNVPLDELKARAARRAIEELIDDLLAVGDETYDIKGFINQSGVDKTFTPSTKAAGGTTWMNGGAPNATALEVVDDVGRFVNERFAALQEAEDMPQKFVVVLPAAEYAYAAIVRTTQGDHTALELILKNPLIEDVVPWHKLSGAGAGGTNRMICYARDPIVLGAVIALEYFPQAVQQKGLNFTVPVTARCGGTVIRYPVAVAYGDGI